MAKKKDSKHTLDKKSKGKQAKNRNVAVNFFRELKAELKRVIWPDKEKMKQSAAVVFGIVIASVILIFVVDSLVNGALTAAHFYDPKLPTVSTTVSEEVVSSDTTVSEKEDSSTSTELSEDASLEETNSDTETEETTENTESAN